MTTTKKTSPVAAEVAADDTDAVSPSPAKPAKDDRDDGIERVTFTVEVRGKTLDITTPVSIEDGPLEVMELMEEGRFIKAMMLLMGPVQEQKLKYQLRPTGRDFNEIIIPAWQEATGMGED